jgi:transcriptional regulator with XRE-family HTH domain
LAVRSPHDAAAQLVAEAPSQDWLRAVTARLDRELRKQPLDRFLTLWDVSQADVAQAFGVTRQAVSKWREEGVPADRMPALTDLATATDLLSRKVKRERIAAVVRRPAAFLDGRSLLELALAGQHADVRNAVSAMFELRRVQP